jgi:hydrogenase maturation factor
MLKKVGIGVGGAVWNGQAERYGTTSVTISGFSKKLGTVLTARFANKLASFGLEPMAASVNLMLPCRFTEEYVKETMQELNEAGEKVGLEVVGCDCETLPGLSFPCAVMSGVGNSHGGSTYREQKIQTGDEIVVCRYIGMEGAAILAWEMEEELLGRYRAGFVKEVQAFAEQLSVLPEARIAAEGKLDVSAIHMVGAGGIFGALWEIAEAADAGLLADARKIPIRQEVIEICEVFGANPYQMSSCGSLLIVCRRGDEMVRTLRQAGIPAQVAGSITEGKDRLVWNGDEKRYLTPPVADEQEEIWKITGTSRLGMED